jgi:hypothetical protein
MHKINVVYDSPDASITDAGYAGQYAAANSQSPEALAEAILKDGAIDGIAAGFSKNFVLPVDLNIHVLSGGGSPHYDPSSKTVNLFYDFANLTADIIKAGNPTMTDTELGKEWAAVNDFVLIHELAHAFINAYPDMPITGREEDAADGMATFFFTDEVPGGAEYAFDAANFFHELQGYQGAPDVTQFQNEHSLSVQRSYDIACKVAGSSDANMAEVAALNILPAERLQRCPDEYAQNSKAWKLLLKPYLRKPTS